MTRSQSGSCLRNEQGVTLLMVLLAVVVMGLVLGLTGQTWSALMQRERESELFFRGDQYRRAIQAYYERAPGGGSYPTELKQLLRDPRSLQPVRYLRQLWSDPLTNGEWELIVEPPNKIKGVRSRSPLKPFQSDGFQAEYEKFNGAESYAAWEFIYEPQSKNTTSPPASKPATP